MSATLVTDLLFEAKPRWAGTIGAGGVAAAGTTTIPLSSAAELDNGDAYIMVINRVTPAGAKNDLSQMETAIGELSGTNLINCVRGVEGTAQAWDAGTVVEILFTATHWNKLIEAWETEHNQDGTHTDITADTINLNAGGSGNILNDNLYRQAIINSNFDVWQRGTSGSPGGSGTNVFGFKADRWYDQAYTGSGGSGSYTLDVSRQAFTLGQTDVPGNPKYFHRFNLSAIATPGTNPYLTTFQAIEGVHHFSGGKATVSFYAKANSNRTWGVTLRQYFGSGGSPSSSVVLDMEEVSVTDSWQKFTLTFDVPSISGKTLGTDGNDSLRLYFYYHQGSTNTGTHATGVFDIAQVQLNAGSVALPFMPKSYEEELRACQRYFYRYTGSSTGNPWEGKILGQVSGLTTSDSRGIFSMGSIIENMRIIPTITVSDASNFRLFSSTTTITPTAIVVQNGHLRAGAAVTAGAFYNVGAVSSAYADISAEL